MLLISNAMIRLSSNQTNVPLELITCIIVIILTS